MRWGLVLLAAVGLFGAAQAAAQTATQSPSRFGSYQPAALYTEQVTQSFYLPLRDGTKVAVLVARPAQNGVAVEGKFPVIWHHSLSATQELGDGTGPEDSGFRAFPRFTDQGYVVVQVARRGNGQSFGTMRGYHDRNEAHDAYEMMDWMAEQPWSNGKIGQYGCSNTGDAAMHAMTMSSPHLKAVFAGCFSFQKYDSMRRGGIFAQWGTGPTRTIEQDMQVQPVDGDADKILLRQAAEEHQRGVPLFELWKSLPFRDSFAPSVQSTFWAEGSSGSYLTQIKRGGVPLYIIGGWRDELRDQGLIAFLNIPGSRIAIGDWLHCMNDGFALNQEALRFFDYHMKGIDTGIAAQDPIHYFVVGADEWRSAKQWPLPQEVATPFALTAKGLNGKGVLNQSFAVDYTTTCKDGGFGPFMQPCYNKGHGLSLAAAPLKTDTEYTGHGIADIWISAPTKDANLFLYVEDVAPDGTVRVVTEGRLKAKVRKLGTAPWALPNIPWHRSYAEDAQDLTPNVPAQMVFEIMPTSWVFKKGHRIQITLTGADWRERARDTDAQPAEITVISDAAHPSKVTLPLVTRRP